MGVCQLHAFIVNSKYNESNRVEYRICSTEVLITCFFILFHLSVFAYTVKLSELIFMKLFDVFDLDGFIYKKSRIGYSRFSQECIYRVSRGIGGL